MNAIVNFVTTIPIANIHPFEDNPYKVQDNEEMQQRNMKSSPATAGCTQRRSWV